MVGKTTQKNSLENIVVEKLEKGRHIYLTFSKKNTPMKRKNKMKKGGRKRSRKRLEKIWEKRQIDGRREEEKKGKGKQNVRILLVQTTKEEGLSVFHFLMMLKPLTVWITTKMWKILKEMGIPGQLTCSWETVCSSKVTIRARHGTTDRFQIGEGIH